MQHYMQRYLWMILFFCLCFYAGANDYDFTGIPPSDDKVITPPETILLESGYALNEESMRSILNGHSRIRDIFSCLEYIEKTRMTALVPEVEKYYQSLEEELTKSKVAMEKKGLSAKEKESLAKRWKSMTIFLESRMMLSIECLFTIERSMSEEKKSHYLEAVRHVLFEREMPNSKIPPLSAYQALVSAWRNQNVDIKDDIVALIKSGRLKNITFRPICGLFLQYGDRVKKKEIKDMLEALKDRPDDRKRIIRQAHKLGMLLDQSVE